MKIPKKFFCRRCKNLSPYDNDLLINTSQSPRMLAILQITTREDKKSSLCHISTSKLFINGYQRSVKYL